jgi:type IV pilus assembly protein PilQ
MRNAVPRNSIPVSSMVVKDVRVGQLQEKNPEVVRVVADLSGDPVFDAHAYAGGVRIELTPRSMAASQAVPPSRQAPALETVAKRDEPKPVRQPLGPAAQVSSKPTHSTVSAVREPQTEVIPSRTNATVPLLATVSGAPTPAKFNAAPKPDYNSALSAGAGSGEAAATPRVAPKAVTPEVLRAEKAARVLDARTASNMAEAQGIAPADSAPPGEENPLYTGEPISLNLKDVDLKDFFRLIHEISGLNILVDPNVTGSVTTVLDNIPWDQALDIVLRNNGLGKVLEGNVLRIAKLDTLAAEQETANKLAAARIDAAPMETVFRPVNYASAQKIAALLKSWLGGGALTRRGTVLVDERTNTLIISDITSQIPTIQGILGKLDTKTKQVAIESRIVLATSSLQRTLSAALVGSISNPSGSTIGAGQTGTQASVAPSTTTTPPSFTIPQNPLSGFGTVAITNFASRYMIDAAISAAEIRSEAKTISRPSIITQNNVQGMVQQGTQIPVQTSINNTISVQYIDATLQLRVTPQVTDDGHIFLNIQVQNRSPGQLVTSVGISINTQEATTQVLVPDGGTVVFGGVTVTQRSNSSNGIPVLGNIPLLGHLFKSSSVQDSDQELLFFVSPRILPG